MAIPDPPRGRYADGEVGVGSGLVVLKSPSPRRLGTNQSSTRPHSTHVLESSKSVRRALLSSPDSVSPSRRAGETNPALLLNAFRSRAICE
ncbi:hypothetical protein HMN09_00281600 [Mycena chlorophos]|uniref:Uncharacterized protein n=1 Tax=Mycena chlorophos TaxID=658473 RepID=A0A8H6TMI8_MYCCL|nr:hypothetical protein HMN09_00281600 [Mycena chlorophos]